MSRLYNLHVDILREVVSLLDFSSILRLACTRDSRILRLLPTHDFVRRLVIDVDSVEERHFQTWLLRNLQFVDEVELLPTLRGAQRFIPTLSGFGIKNVTIRTPLHDGTPKPGMHEPMVPLFAAIWYAPLSFSVAALDSIFPHLLHLI